MATDLTPLLLRSAMALYISAYWQSISVLIIMIQDFSLIFFISMRTCLFRLHSQLPLTPHWNFIAEDRVPSTESG